jgi:hypothetical protein
MHALTPETAARFAEIALGHVTREYPHKLDHVLDGPEDVLGPRALHPIFFGSFDWHSCVHGWWLLLRVRRLFADLPVARRIERLADEMLAPDKVAGERAYLDRAYTGGFERPYGWAWLLALHGEARRHGDRSWGADLAPLAEAFADRFRAFLPKLTYPIRTGTHFNTAFAIVLALDWAEANDAALADLLRERARAYYGGDRDCPAWEPGGDDFADRGPVHAPLPPGGGFPRVVRRVPAAHRRAAAAEPVYARPRLRSLGRQDRAPGRGEPQPRLVLAPPRRRARPAARRARPRHRTGASRRQSAARCRRLYGRALAGDLRAARAGGVTLP